MAAALAISKSKIILLCVGCCSFVMMATLRLQFLVHQASLAPTSLHDARIYAAQRPINHHNHDNGAHVQQAVPRKQAYHKEEVGNGLRKDVVPVVAEEAKLPRAAVVQQQQANTTTNTTHMPNYFTDEVSFETLVKRDHLVSVFTGCSIAAWTYTGVTFHKAKVRFYDDCKCYHEEHNVTSGRDISPETASTFLQANDTLYVELKKISHFVQHTLPKITVPIVLISGQNHLVPQKPQKLDYVWSQRDFDAVVANKYITHWFMMNMDVYAQDPDNEKLHPFPYGLGSTGNHTPDTAEVGMNPMHAFKDELRVSADSIPKKNNSIFVGYFSMRTNREMRKLVPQGEKLHPALQFRRMHMSKYVISPNGDRPDCYRHYEAIGVGAMPITQLHPKYYRHLKDNVIFNNTNWNLEDLERNLPKNSHVNRRLVFDEYWMEYVERIVGRPLRWWDSSRQVRCSLEDITESVKGMEASS